MDVPKAFVCLSAAAHRQGIPLYLVGGCVRDLLLGREGKDFDITGPIPPMELERIESDEIIVTDRIYGLGTLLLSQKTQDGSVHYEYTAFRKDNYGRGGAHTPSEVSFGATMDEDAQRRDFTVNALYLDTDGKLYDPLGAGLEDLSARRLRQVLTDTLAQDALRILRLVRFAARLDFSVEAETMAYAKKYAEQLQNISKERIYAELKMILLADTLGGDEHSVLRGLRLLKETGALAYVLPCLLAGDGFAQNPSYHAYDVLEHSFRVCAATPPELTLRLAGLLHDVSKPQAYEEDGNFYEHPRMGAWVAREALQQLKADAETIKTVPILVENHMFDLENKAKDYAVIKTAARLGEENFLRLCSLREADFLGSGRGNKAQSAEKWRAVYERLRKAGAPLDLKDLAVSGDDLMRELKLSPGKEIGRLLLALQTHALKKPSQNNYKSLIRYATMIVTEKNG